MWPDRVSNPEPLTYEFGALPIVLGGPANSVRKEVAPIEANSVGRRDSIRKVSSQNETNRK